MTVDKDNAFSDSDIFLEELCFRPATHIWNVPEKQENCLESTLNLGDNNNSRFSPSQKAEPNGHLINHASSPVERNFMVAQHASKSFCILIIKTICLDKWHNYEALIS